MIVEIVTALIILAASTAGTLLIRVFIRGLKTYLRDEIRTHLVPNGGSSMADRLKRVEDAVEEIRKNLTDTGCMTSGCQAPSSCRHSRMQDHKTSRQGLFGWHRD